MQLLHACSKWGLWEIGLTVHLQEVTQPDLLHYKPYSPSPALRTVVGLLAVRHHVPKPNSGMRTAVSMVAVQT